MQGYGIKQRLIDSISTQEKLNERTMQRAESDNPDSFDEEGAEARSVSSSFIFIMQVLSMEGVRQTLGVVLHTLLFGCNGWFADALRALVMSEQARASFVQRIRDGSFFKCAVETINYMSQMRNITPEQFGLMIDNCIERKIAPRIVYDEKMAKQGAMLMAGAETIDQDKPKPIITNEEDLVMTAFLILGSAPARWELGKAVQNIMNTESTVMYLVRRTAGINLQRIKVMLETGAVFTCMRSLIVNLGPGPTGMSAKQEFLVRWKACDQVSGGGRRPRARRSKRSKSKA
jgi:hypothetical protein